MKYSLSESKEHLQPFAGIRIIENVFLLEINEKPGLIANTKLCFSFAGIRIIENVFLLEINEKPGLIANTKLCFSSSFMANSLFICFQ